MSLSGLKLKTIYYCSESRFQPNPSRCYVEFEKKLIRFIQEKNNYQLCRLEKPEIYKHPVAFEFLEGFASNALHLIIRKPENIRLLKNARNVLILPAIISEAEMTRTPAAPFEDLKRMFSLVDEIWTTQKDNLDCLKEWETPVTYFKDEIAVFNNIALFCENN